MTPQEKAEKLIQQFSFKFPMGSPDSFIQKQAKECALITVEEILNSNPTWFIDQMKSSHKYWEDVRAALNVL